MPVIVITENTTVQNAVAPDAVFAGLSEVAIRQENPTANFTADASLALGNGLSEGNVGIFDVAGLASAAIPVNATINTATLYMVPGGGFGTFGISAHESLRSVVLSEATYNSFATGSSWETAGARGTLDKTAATDTVTTVDGTDPTTFDITDVIQDLIVNSNDQLILSPTAFDGDGGFRFFAKSTSTDGTRPEIVIDYTVSGTDTDPDQFTFTAQTDVALNTFTASNTVTITGINTAAPISVVGGEYSIDGSAFTAASGTINNNQTVQVRGLSSSIALDTRNVVLTIGTVSDTFTITNAASSIVRTTGFGFGANNFSLQDISSSAQVVRVTNNNSTGAGSLKEAVTTTATNIAVVFEAGGVFNIEDVIFASNADNIWLVGETANGPVSIHNGEIRFANAQNVYMSHLRFRSGDRDYLGTARSGETLTDIDGLGFVGFATNALPKNVVMQNVSMAWTLDEMLRIRDGITHVSLADCIFAEPLHNSVRPTNPHSYGAYITGTQQVTIARSVFSHMTRRMPRMDSGQLEFINNVVYNPGVHIIHAQDSPIVLDAIGNVVLFPSDLSNNFNSLTDPLEAFFGNRDTVVGGSQAYLLDNILPDLPSSPGTPIPGAIGIKGGVNPVINTTRNMDSGVVPMPSGDVISYVTANAGARPDLARDAVDARAIAQLTDLTGTYVDSQESVGSYPVLAPTSRTISLPPVISAEYIESFPREFPTGTPTSEYFEESGGVLSIEAESYQWQEGSAWGEQADVAFSGGVAMVAASGGSATYSSGLPRMAYKINVTTAGTYYPYVLCQRGPLNEESFWMAVDDGAGIRFNATTGAFWRSPNAGETITLSAGDHTLYLSPRNNNVPIDKIYLSTVQAAPTGQGPAESNFNSVFEDVIYDGNAPDFSNNESWPELIFNDFGIILEAGNIIHYEAPAGTTVNASGVPSFPVGTTGGSYAFTIDGVRSDEYLWTVQDFIPSTSITGNQNITIAENTAFSQIYTITNPVGVTTLSGVDAGVFTFADNGAIATLSLTSFNFDAPADSGTDNIYNVTVSNNGVDYPVVITVTDDAAEFTIDVIANVTVDEGVAYTSVTPNITGTPEAPVAYSLTGADAAQFTVNGSTGVVSMIARDFGAPADANSNNIYEIGLIATDNVGQTATQTWTVTVEEVITGSVPTISAGQTFTVVENATIGTTIGTLSFTANGTISQIITNNPLVSINNVGLITVAQTTSIPTDLIISATAVNETGSSAATSFTVTVSDVDESILPTAENFVLSITNASASNIAGGVLGSLVFTDATTAPTLAGTNASAFSLTGNQLELVAPLAVGSYSATYSVSNVDTDSGSSFLQTATGNITLTITEASTGTVDIQPILDAIAALQIDVDNITTTLTGLLTASDSRLDNLDVPISTRLPTASYTAPDNTTIGTVESLVTNLNNISTADIRTELSTELSRLDVAISSRLATGTVSLSPSERVAIATSVEAALLNEGDGQQLIDAISQAVASADIDEVALAALVRTDLERSGGLLDLTLKTNDARLGNLDAPISGIVIDGVNLQPVLDAVAETLQTNDPRIPQIVAAVVTSIPDLISDVPSVAENQSGLATSLEISSLGTPLQTDDVRLDNLDAPISGIDVDLSAVLSAIALTVQSSDIRLDSLTSIQTVTDQLTFSGSEVQAVVSQTGYSLSSQAISDIAVAVESSLLNEADGQQLLNAIVGAIGNTNISEVALVSAIRSDLERANGLLQSVGDDVVAIGSPVQLNDSRLNAIGVPLQATAPVLSNLDVAVSTRATAADVVAVTGDVSVISSSISNVELLITNLETSLTTVNNSIDTVVGKLFYKSAYFDINGNPVNPANAVREVFYAQDGVTIIATAEGRDINGNPASGSNIVEVVPV